MSWLYIDTRQKDESHIAWLSEEEGVLRREIKGRGKAVLTAIEKDWEQYAPALKGVIVVSGPGSFSSIRTGVLYANLFSRFLGLPMYEMIGGGELELEEVLENAKAGKLTKKQYIEPIYDREPNITKPKS